MEQYKSEFIEFMLICFWRFLYSLEKLDFKGFLDIIASLKVLYFIEKYRIVVKKVCSKVCSGL